MAPAPVTVTTARVFTSIQPLQDVLIDGLRVDAQNTVRVDIYAQPGRVLFVHPTVTVRNCHIIGPSEDVLVRGSWHGFAIGARW